MSVCECHLAETFSFDFSSQEGLADHLQGCMYTKILQLLNGGEKVIQSAKAQEKMFYHLGKNGGQ